MAGYTGPNNRRYEKRQWLVVAVLTTAVASVLGWLRLRKK
jgi:hypothetical protein